MKIYQEAQEILNQLSPIPVNMPKIYFLGDTGAGKTTIIRKILGTDKLNFPTTRQTRTTVAITEYVISSSLPFMGSFIIKSEDEIRGLIKEILQDALTKIYKEEISNKTTLENKRLQHIKQTSDQRFRLYYLINDEEQKNIVASLIKLAPVLEKNIKQLVYEFPDEPEQQEIFIELSIEELSKNELLEIENNIYSIIKENVKQTCRGYDLSTGSGNYQINANSLDSLIQECKPILSSEKGSISPVIEYARLQGNIIASWLNDEQIEVVIIDGEGIGHSTKEAGQLDSRHYDYFYNSHSIVLVEESKKPFVAGGKSALKSIYERGYADKLLLIFSKLDEVMPYDLDEVSREDQIDEVNFSLNNVISSLDKENIKIDINEDSIFYLSNVNEDATNEITKDETIRIINKSIALMSSTYDFSKPIYDFEMLSAFLLEAAKEFSIDYSNLLRQQHWQTIKAFNRRMTWGSYGFRMFTPVSDIEDTLTVRLQEFLSNPQTWTENVTDKVKTDSINKIKRELNQLLLKYAYETIVKIPKTDWDTAISYSGAGSTDTRRYKIFNILGSAIPKSVEANIASRFKDDIKKIILEAISTSEKTSEKNA
jgi:hypothetical protein